MTLREKKIEFVGLKMYDDLTDDDGGPTEKKFKKVQKNLLGNTV